MTRFPLVLMTSVLLLAGARAEEVKPKDGAKNDPPGAVVEVKLVAKKATYTLDLAVDDRLSTAVSEIRRAVTRCAPA